MYYHHSLEVIIDIIPYVKKIEFNNCYFISEVAFIRDEQKGIFSSVLSQNKVIFISFVNLIS